MTTNIIGTGSYLPKNVVTNDDLSHIVETSDEWISTRTGIKSRHISTNEDTVTLAYEAAKRALENANVTPQDIDLIIVATLTPSNSMPNTACSVQAKLGNIGAMCFDVNAACSGFLYSLSIAHAMMTTQQMKRALIIGAENLSKIVDWSDRGTCVLFGDGAGAVVMELSQTGIIDYVGGADGSRGDVLKCNDRPLNNFLCNNVEQAGYMTMDGQEVFKFAVKKVPEIIGVLLEKNQCNTEDVDVFVLHQANQRIISSVAKKLSVDEERFPMNLDRCGNTSAASIPILLDELNRNGRLQKGSTIVLAGFGGGLTWGAMLLRWQ